MVPASVPVTLARSLAARVERVAATAGGGGVRVIDREPAAHQVFLVVHLGAFEVAQAHRVHDDLDPFLFEHLVAFGRFVESQTAWDRAMAEALARYVVPGSAGEKRLVVGLMGSSHVRFGYGVPHQLRDLGVKNVGTMLTVPVGLDCSELQTGLADAVFALPESAKATPEPPRLGVRLEENAGTVRIADVTAGSLAEKTGLKAGDQIVEVAGLPVNRMTRVIAAIRLQPAGTWLPFRVKRGDELLELMVMFPPK